MKGLELPEEGLRRNTPGCAKILQALYDGRVLSVTPNCKNIYNNCSLPNNRRKPVVHKAHCDLVDDCISDIDLIMNWDYLVASDDETCRAGKNINLWEYCEFGNTEKEKV